LTSSFDAGNHDFDDALIARINQLTDTSDTTLLGRKMTGGFISYWEGVQPQSLDRLDGVHERDRGEYV